MRLAEEFWPQRFTHAGQALPLDRAIAQASSIDGPVIFTDAADATSSGATGDSNVILKGLREAGYGKRVLAQIVDPQAAAAAHEAGVGATIDVDARRRSRSRSASRRCRCARGAAPVGRPLAAGDHEDRARCGADRGADLRQFHRRGVQPHRSACSIAPCTMPTASTRAIST